MNRGGNFSVVNYFRLLATLLVTLWLSNCCAEKVCRNEKNLQCMCQLKNGTVINLTTVGDNTKPRFQDLPDPNGVFRYSYNPCYSFSMGGEKWGCYHGVAVCQSKPGTEEYYNAGIQDSTTYYDNGTHIIIEYRSEESLLRSTNVTLVCSPNTKLTFLMENQTRHYEMVLESPCACPDGCVSKPPPEEGISTGSVLVILLFTFIFCYLVGGILYQKIVRGAQGYELIPNYEFWYDFPLLIRDGCIFCSNGCNTAPPRAVYDSI